LCVTTTSVYDGLRRKYQTLKSSYQNGQIYFEHYYEPNELMKNGGGC